MRRGKAGRDGLVVGTGLAVALALAMCAGFPADDELVEGTIEMANAKPGQHSPGSPASGWPMPATPAAVPTEPSPAFPSTPTPTAFAVPITVAAPQKLLVGEMSELIVGVGANTGLSEISFTVQFDADVLQVRVGAEGDWTAGAGPNAIFSAKISDAEDRLQIRSAVSGRQLGTAGGSVAIVQFQAVAAGTTLVMISDVVVKDSAGRWIAPAVSVSSLQMTVDSVPPPLPGALGKRLAVAIEPPHVTSEDGD
jgi:hypothetical protein